MPSTKVSKSPASFDIKSALLPLESVIIRSDDINIVEKDLEARFAKHPDFFDNDPVMIDLTQFQDNKALGSPELTKLCQILKKFKMNPVAIRSNHTNHQAWAELAGLFLISQSQMPPETKRGVGSENHATTPHPETGTESTSNLTTTPPAQGPTSNTEPTSKAAQVGEDSSAGEVTSTSCALIIDKPLRSGQHVYAKGRDLIVMAMVNPGAEIMADGHIHVYAPLRGKAIAGAKGNKEARIYTSCLEAELISIAGIYRTSDTPIPKEVAGRSAQIRLIDDKLVMQPK